MAESLKNHISSVGLTMNLNASCIQGSAPDICTFNLGITSIIYFFKSILYVFFLLKESKHNANEVCNNLRNK